MTILTQASRQLFARSADERYASLADVLRATTDMKNRCVSTTIPRSELRPFVHDSYLSFQRFERMPIRLNNWSFTQLCQLASASKDTVNRLTADTAVQVFTDLLSSRDERDDTFQTLVFDDRVVRSMNGPGYRRLWNGDLVRFLMEYAIDFVPPQKGFNGATGLYAGEQDMFCFLINPSGWVEIGKEAFAPGFFVWNSEVGRRSIGISTFWFQSICCNHIVWDATEITEYTRRHTGAADTAFTEIRRLIEALVEKRDGRKDAFASVIAKAMKTRYGHDAEDVTKQLVDAGFVRTLATRAAAIAEEKGRFSIWSIVDALTQLSREHAFAAAGARRTRRRRGSSRSRSPDLLFLRPIRH
jgi:hypothetical protein